jgi:lysozyme
VASTGSKLKAWLFLLILIAGLGVAGWWWMHNRFAVQGIDISHYQGEIHWEAVRDDGVAFAFIKATEGTTLVDDRFAANWRGAGEAGIARGAYHFFRPTLGGAAQAQHFLAHVRYQKGDLPPVLDLEVTDDATAGAIQREALAWCEAVEQAWGVRPIVYTLPHYADSYLDSKFARYPLWIVDLGLRLWPSTSKGWPKWTFWQHSHRGSIDGIAGDVDLNVFYGSQVEFEALLGD